MEFTRSEGLCLVVGENKVLQVDVRLNIAPTICGALKVAADQVCTAAMHKPNDNLETRQAGRGVARGAKARNLLRRILD